MIKFETKDGYERIAFAEVLVPDTPNVYGDFHTKESVRQFAYGFMINGFDIDLDHDNVSVTAGVRIIESFIAGENDSRGFTEGAWVVGIHVLDDDIWNDILTGELNGFSYQALVSTLDVTVDVDSRKQVIGETYPDIDDGHTHQFWVVLDDNGRVLTGGTTSDHGHSHTISKHTYTDDDDAGTHLHRYDVVRAEQEMIANEAA